MASQKKGICPDTIRLVLYAYGMYEYVQHIQMDVHQMISSHSCPLKTHYAMKRVTDRNRGISQTHKGVPLTTNTLYEAQDTGGMNECLYTETQNNKSKV